MLSQIGRAAIRRIGAGTPQPSTNQVGRSILQLQRVRASAHAKNDSRFAQATFPLLHRFYATASKSTQTTNTKSKTPTVRKPRTKAVAPKNVANKTSTKAAKKPVKKAAPKATSKPTKKVLTPEQRKELLEKRKVVELSEAALLDGPSKPGKHTVFNRVVSETLTGKGKDETLATNNNRFREAIQESLEKYKSLTPAELEKYNHTLNQEKAALVVAYKQWVESHTPDQIRLANSARRALKRKGLQGRKGFGRLEIIEDSRLPTKNRNSFMYFVQDRQASGDFKGLRSPDAVKLLGKEWAGLSADQQKVYKDKAQSDSSRYQQEYKTVYRHDSPSATA